LEFSKERVRGIPVLYSKYTLKKNNWVPKLSWDFVKIGIY